MTEASSFAVLTRALEHSLEPADEGEDPFYARSDYVDEFLAAVKQFNTTVIDDPCYAAFLGAWGANLLYPDRLTLAEAPVRHRRARASAIEHPSQIRAIPHNASCSRSASSPTPSAASARRSARTRSSSSGSTARARASAG